MIPLYTNNQLLISKSSDKLPLECEYCHTTFLKQKRAILRIGKDPKTTCQYCSKQCRDSSRKNHIRVHCTNCNKSIIRPIYTLKSKNIFCSQSCSGTYNNTHRTHGYRRSKLEIYLEEQLTLLYPDLEIHFNRKDAINSELDIYIPSLKLAFELNGIFHYEPIYGQDKLDQITNNDNRKFQACAELGISLCMIDVSQQKYFKSATSKKYLDIIINTISGQDNFRGYVVSVDI